MNCTNTFSVESILFKDINNNSISNTNIKVSKSIDDCVYDAYKSSEDLKFYETYTMINDYNTKQKLRMLNKLRNITKNIHNTNINNSCESYIRSIEENENNNGEKKKNIFIRILKGFIDILTFIPRMIIKAIQMFINFVKRKREEIKKNRPEERAAQNNIIYENINRKKQEICDKYISEWSKGTELIKSGKDYDGYKNEFRSLCLEIREYFKKLSNEVKLNNNISATDKTSILNYIEEADYMARTNYDKFEHDIRHFKKFHENNNSINVADIEKETNDIKDSLNNSMKKEKDSFNNLNNAYNELEDAIKTNSKKKIIVTFSSIKKIYDKYFSNLEPETALPFIDYYNVNNVDKNYSGYSKMVEKSRRQATEFYELASDIEEDIRNPYLKDNPIGEKSFDRLQKLFCDPPYENEEQVLENFLSGLGFNTHSLITYKHSADLCIKCVKFSTENLPNGKNKLKDYIETNISNITSNGEIITENLKKLCKQLDAINNDYIAGLNLIINGLKNNNLENEKHMKILNSMREHIQKTIYGEEFQNKILNNILIKEMSFFTDLLKETGLDQLD